MFRPCWSGWHTAIGLSHRLGDGNVVSSLHCMNDPQPEGHMASYIGRRKFLATLGGAVVAWPLTARAQQTGRRPKLGIVYLGPVAMASPRVDALLNGLRAVGYGARAPRAELNGSKRRCSSLNTITWSVHSRRAEPIKRSTRPFCQGERKDVGRSRIPIARTRALNAAPKALSLSRMRNFGAVFHGNASVIWRANHSAVGLRVTANHSNCRRLWPRTRHAKRC